MPARMFVARKESGWNMISKAMKCMTAKTYRCSSLGEEPMGHMKLFLSKVVSLIRVEMGLGWVVCGDWRCLRQSQDLR